MLTHLTTYLSLTDNAIDVETVLNFLKNLPVYTDEDILAVEHETRSQAANPLGHKFREGHVASSCDYTTA